METVLVIIFLVQLVAFIGIIICIACEYESKLKETEKRRIEDMLNLGKGFHVCYKDRLLREKDNELKLSYLKIKELGNQIEKNKQKEQEKEQAIEISHAINLTFKDMIIKEREDEIKKLKKRKKSK